MPHRRRASLRAGASRRACGVLLGICAVAGARLAPAAELPPPDRVAEVAFTSAALGREKHYAVVRPAAERVPGAVLFLLHGRGRNYRSLLDRPDTRAALLQAGYYVVLPDGEDGWYIDSPVPPHERYASYLEEVIRDAGAKFPLSHDRGRRAITGWSMGGYGAVHFAETHPKEFGTVAGIIGLLDFPRAGLPPGQDYTVPVARFGDDPAGWVRLNPINGIDALRGDHVLVITASDSFDRTMNENFVARARAQDIPCQFTVLPGGHKIETVAAALPIVVRFVGESFEQAAPRTSVGPAASASSATEPMNRRVDEYPSRDAFLAAAARFQLERLEAQPWRDDDERAFFSDPVRQVHIGNTTLEFHRIPAAAYRDGLTPELKAQVLAIPNRSHDMQRWADSLDTRHTGKVTVPYDFYISTTSVTNAQFAAFVRETGYRTTVEQYAAGWVVDSGAHWRQGFANAWNEQVYPTSAPDHPVVQVSWFDAMQFAAWLSAKTGVLFRLPTKEEWLLAARPPGAPTEALLFPWGNSFAGIGHRMNFGTADLRGYGWIHDQFADGYARSSPVTAFPPNARGLYDMLGNVWGWNWSSAAAYAQRPAHDYEVRPVELASLGADRNDRLMMSGGCYLARLTHANLLGNMAHPALDGAEDIGFRLVAVRSADSGLPLRSNRDHDTPSAR